MQLAEAPTLPRLRQNRPSLVLPYPLLLLKEARPDPTNPFNSLTNHQPSAVATNSSQSKQNLIDFFASIESEQTTMFPAPQQQQQQFAPQPQVYTNPSFNPTFTAQPTNQFPLPPTNQPFYQSQHQQQFPAEQQYTASQQPIRPEWTGAGFGGYTPSSAGSPVHIMPTISSGLPTQSQFAPPPTTSTQAQFSPPMQSSGLQTDRNSTGTTNPFRASTLPHANTFPTTDQGTNPFATGQRAQTTISSGLSHNPSFNAGQTSFSSVPAQPQSAYQQPFQGQSQPAFQQPPSQQQQQQPVFQQPSQSQPVFNPQAPIQTSTSTGTNPFSRPPQLHSQARLTPQVTGSNPFRQSVMPGGTSASTVNGFGWSQQ